MLTAEQFEEFLENASEKELFDSYVTLEAERESIWTVGSMNSYRHDRYEYDAILVARLVKIKSYLMKTWIESGQINPLRFSINAVD